ncbi:MAG: hypothetical protein M1833_001638 [Piccolia ochrophora]|nr:MAG: hypothetical protein M1833_001638 [Piccolia ochrophora]
MPGYAAVNDDRGSSRPPSNGWPARGRRRQYSRGAKDNGNFGQASWISSVINLVNTIVGAGVLAMPSAMSHMGIILGTFVILFAGVTAGFGLYLQTRCAKYLDRGSSSFFALSQMTYPSAAIIFDAAIAVKCFGVGVSYLIIIGDLMPGVVRAFSERAGEIDFMVDRHFWVTAFMLIVIPLSFLRRLDSLKYTSIVALVSIGYLVILVLAHFLKGDTMEDRGAIRIIQWGGAVPTLSSFPVIVFAYTCHQNMFSILNEIKDNSHRSTTSVVSASIGSSGLIYILVAITGYLSFGNNVAGNLIGMYPPAIASTIGKAAIVVLVMFSYPLQVHPCRASIDAVLKWRPSSFHSSSSREPANSSPSRTLLLGPARSHHSSRSATAAADGGMSDTRFAAITSVVIIASYVVAMTVSSLEMVLAYVGSTGSTSISFILPGLFYYKISDPDSAHTQRLLKEDDDERAAGDQSDSGDEETLLGGGGPKGGQWRKNLLRRLSLALALYGFVVMVVCLVTNTFFIVAH